MRGEWLVYRPSRKSHWFDEGEPASRCGLAHREAAVPEMGWSHKCKACFRAVVEQLRKGEQE